MTSQSLVMMVHPDFLINSNQRLHWRVKARKVTYLRQLATAAINATDLRPVERRQHITVTFGFLDHRLRDALNYEPTVKPLIDAIVKAGVLPSDDFRWVVGPDLRIGALSPDCQTQPHRRFRRVLIAVRMETSLEPVAA